MFEFLSVIPNFMGQCPTVRIEVKISEIFRCFMPCFSFMESFVQIQCTDLANHWFTGRFAIRGAQWSKCLDLGLKGY